MKTSQSAEWGLGRAGVVRRMTICISVRSFKILYKLNLIANTILFHCIFSENSYIIMTAKFANKMFIRMCKHILLDIGDFNLTKQSQSSVNRWNLFFGQVLWLQQRTQPPTKKDFRSHIFQIFVTKHRPWMYCSEPLLVWNWTKTKNVQKIACGWLNLLKFSRQVVTLWSGYLCGVRQEMAMEVLLVLQGLAASSEHFSLGKK